MNLFLTARERENLRQVLPLLEISIPSFALAVLWGATGLGAAVALGSTAAWLIARASQQPPVLYLQVAVTAVRLFGISRAVFRYIERLSSHRVALDGMARLRTNAYARMAQRDTATIAAMRRGQILNRTGADVDAVGDFVVKSLLPMCVAVIVGSATTIGVCLLEWRAGLALGLCLAISGIAGPALTMSATRRAEAATQAARANLVTNATTLVESAAELAVSGRSSEVIAAMKQAEIDLQKAQDRAARPAALAQAIDTAMMVLAVVAGTYFGAHAVLAGNLSQVALAVVAITPLAAFEATASLSAASAQLVRSAGAAGRILELLSGPEDTDANQLGAPGPYRIEVKDADLAWPNGPVVATGINLDVAPGRKIAIVGRSGAGKSTLLYSLCGMLSPRAGTISVSGINGGNTPQAIGSLRRNEAARAICMTAEDAHVFAASVYENLRVVGPDVSEQQALEAIEKAGLGSWLASLPEGLNTQLGSEATTISGGERRRLLLARALCANATVLAVDEPAEHLDGPTADRLITDLFELAGPDRAIVVVTHRLSPLAAADEVIMLETSASGPTRISARGSHAELVESDPDYRFALQQEQSEIEGE